MSPHLSVTYATPLILDVTPSRRVKYFILLINLLALIALLLLPLPGSVRLGLCLLLVLLCLHALRRQHQYYRLVWHEEHWFIQHRDREQEATLLPSSFVTPWLTILNFVTQGKTLSVLLLADSVNGDSFRRLRVRLKVSGRNSTTHAKMNS